jgi:hypothetical protein
MKLLFFLLNTGKSGLQIKVMDGNFSFIIFLVTLLLTLLFVGIARGITQTELRVLRKKWNRFQVSFQRMEKKQRFIMNLSFFFFFFDIMNGLLTGFALFFIGFGWLLKEKN